jgi:hypothetical protein
LLGEFLPAALSISIGLKFTGSFPIWIGEDGLKVSEKVVMLLPFVEKGFQCIKHVLFVIHSIFELPFFNFRIFSHTIDNSYLLVNFLSNNPIMLREVVDQTFT